MPNIQAEMLGIAAFSPTYGITAFRRQTRFLLTCPTAEFPPPLKRGRDREGGVDKERIGEDS